ncbi:hypothetical protein TanjilG_20945 [Lupinus angustifolius]|uniref:FAS1 domain-containing protein n=1 Tax=Lupinus angustifolius TaxID=3871 RepID=A0A1J7FVM5_LUPAN|nr:PREDICTED: fasciclin-like arabinogalactan protein 6 [Lupinus angustifolius]OIV92015.1 hypothetical protein TanjilG_20945 [Lupinus angustifolius]
MASNNLALILLTLTPFLFLLTPQTRAQHATSGPANLTATLESGGQYNTFIRLLNETQQIIQIQSQLNTTTQGFTIFAPTDNAFQTLASGAINGLTVDQKVKLVLYHIIPKYYLLIDLLTVSNPVSTEASWGLNFTGHGNQVNVSTGVVETALNNALREQFPLAVYEVDKVLLPLELFGTKTPKSASTPKSAPSPKSSKSSPDEIPSPATAADAAQSPLHSKNGAAGMNVGLGMVIGLGLICMGAMS